MSEKDFDGDGRRTAEPPHDFRELLCELTHGFFVDSFFFDQVPELLNEALKYCYNTRLASRRAFDGLWSRSRWAKPDAEKKDGTIVALYERLESRLNKEY